MNNSDGPATITLNGLAPLQVLQGGSGPTLVWLHGEEGQRGWLPHHARLAERFTVLAPTLPGIGASVLPEWVSSVRDMAKVLLAALDGGRIGNCVLGGASMGGWIAAEMASMEPGRFPGLVVAGSQGTSMVDMKIHPDVGAWMAPPGYVSREAAIARRRYMGGTPYAFFTQGYEKALDTRQIIIGSPDTVVRQLNELRLRFGVGHLGVSHFAVEDYGRTMRNLELLGEEVFPRLRELAAGD